jgi:outer membrane protein W
VVAALTVMLLSGGPAAADWTFRLHGALVEASADTGDDAADGAPESSYRFGTSGGLGIGFEILPSRWVGIEFSTLLAGMSVEVATSDTGTSISEDLAMMPFTLGAPIHFIPGERPVDLYLAPTLNYVTYFNLDLRTGDDYDIDVDLGSDRAPGLTLGLEAPGNRKWAFSASARYLRTSREDVDINPYIYSLGFAVHFD